MVRHGHVHLWNTRPHRALCEPSTKPSPPTAMVVISSSSWAIEPPWTSPSPGVRPCTSESWVPEQDWYPLENQHLIKREEGLAQAQESKSVLDVRSSPKPPKYDLLVEMNKPFHQPHLENFFESVRGNDTLNCPGRDRLRNGRGRTQGQRGGRGPMPAGIQARGFRGLKQNQDMRDKNTSTIPCSMIVGVATFLPKAGEVLDRSASGWALLLLISWTSITQAQTATTLIGDASDGSQCPAVHHMDLYTHDGFRIFPGVNDDQPFSQRITCGKCHDVVTIESGWHFNAGQKGVQDGRPGEPWIF